MKTNKYKQMTKEQKEVFLMCFYQVHSDTLIADFVDYYIQQNKKFIKENLELLEENIKLKEKLKEYDSKRNNRSNNDKMEHARHKNNKQSYR